MAARRAGARTAVVIDAPVAASIGAGIDVSDERPTMVVDIGGCWTEVAVIAAGAMEHSKAVAVGGMTLDLAIRDALVAVHGLLVPLETAEELKLAMASAIPLASEGAAEVTGHDVDGTVCQVVVTSPQVRDWIRQPVNQMLHAVTDVLDVLPARRAADLLDSEIVLTGGGAHLRGFAQRLQRATGVPVRVAHDSEHAAVVGAGYCAEQVAVVGAEGLEPPTSAV